MTLWNLCKKWVFCPPVMQTMKYPIKTNLVALVQNWWMNKTITMNSRLIQVYYRTDIKNYLSLKKIEFLLTCAQILSQCSLKSSKFSQPFLRSHSPVSGIPAISAVVRFLSLPMRGIQNLEVSLKVFSISFRRRLLKINQ